MNSDKKKMDETAEELAAYEKLRLRVSKSFGELNEKLSRESINQTMDNAVEELREMGEYSRQSIARAAETLKKDIASTAEKIKPRVDKATAPAREQFDSWMGRGGALWQDIMNEAGYIKEVSRDKGGIFFLNITNALHEWSRNTTEKLGTSLKYKTGEMTHGGEFICTECGGKIHLKKPGRIPPCPKCTNSEFHRA